jgi:hypothetical protein
MNNKDDSWDDIINNEPIAAERGKEGSYLARHAYQHNNNYVNFLREQPPKPPKPSDNKEEQKNNNLTVI